jgi:hypothetical protein
VTEVSELYRQWLRHLGGTGNRLVVECGRLIEPWHVLRAGLVPYWCRDPGRATVHGSPGGSPATNRSPPHELHERQPAGGEQGGERVLGRLERGEPDPTVAPRIMPSRTDLTVR